MLRTSKQRISRLNKRFNSFKGRSNINLAQVKKFLGRYLKNEDHKAVVFNILSNKKRYTNEIKAISQKLLAASPVAYNVVRDTFKLPCRETVSKFVKKKVSVSPGISRDIIYQIHQHFMRANSKIKKIQVPVSLILDEISIKSRLEFDRKEQKLIGLEDSKHKRTGNLARYALCVMINGLANNYRQLLGYVFTHKPAGVPLLKEFVFEAIDKVNKTGLKVVALTTDQGTNFCKFFNDLGVTEDRPFFQVNGDKIFIIPDPCHLEKSGRNAALENKIMTEEGVVEWEVIKETKLICDKNSLSLIPKVSYKHIYLPPYGGKMLPKYSVIQ